MKARAMPSSTPTRRAALVLLSLACTQGGLTLPNSTAPLLPTAAAQGTQSDANPEDEARRLKQGIENHLKERLPAISGIAVEVLPIGGGRFAVVLSGELGDAKDPKLVEDTVAGFLHRVSPRGTDLYAQRLKQKLPSPPTESAVSDHVKLHFRRSAPQIVALLKSIKELEPLQIQNLESDEIILHGQRSQRLKASQIIAALDQPFPGVAMEMWGVQLSSKSPNRMAATLRDAREDIDMARAAVHATLGKMQSLAAGIDPNGTIKNSFCDDAKGLGFTSALSRYNVQSVVDILIRLVAAEGKSKDTQEFANDLTRWLWENADTREYVAELNGIQVTAANQRSMPRLGTPPFERFFQGRGLQWDGYRWSTTPGADAVIDTGRVTLLKFAHQYWRYVNRPDNFSPYFLQQTSDNANTRLQASAAALNQDLQALFTAATLERIRRRAARTEGVEYAQVGKTSIAGLSSAPVKVTGTAASQFDVTPPLRLSELLGTASKLSDEAGKFVPKVPGPAGDLVEPVITGGIPYRQLIGLIAAFGEERAVWRELTSGVSVDITPNVLRNSASAELAINLSVGDPLDTTKEKAPGVRPLSRVTKHDLNTKVYVRSLDLFDVSTFSSQATVDGGRGYFPILGPVWKGLFGEVPVVGDLFSWRRSPRSVYHQSLILTNSIITPTSMSVALLYPTEGTRLSFAEARERLQADAEQAKQLEYLLDLEQRGVLGDVEKFYNQLRSNGRLTHRGLALLLTMHRDQPTTYLAWQKDQAGAVRALLAAEEAYQAGQIRRCLQVLGLSED